METRNNNILLTKKESLEIAELLETLEAMGGVCDEDFNMECERAGELARRMRKIITNKFLNNKKMKAQKNHYLVVVNAKNVIENLNCSQETEETDKVLAELTKDDWYAIQELAQKDGLSLCGSPEAVFVKYHDLYFEEAGK